MRRGHSALGGLSLPYTLLVPSAPTVEWKPLGLYNHTLWDSLLACGQEVGLEPRRTFRLKVLMLYGVSYPGLTGLLEQRLLGRIERSRRKTGLVAPFCYREGCVWPTLVISREEHTCVMSQHANMPPSLKECP